MRIDAHHHLWTLERGDYGWLTPDLAPIYRDFSFADLEPHLDRAGIVLTVLVQAAPTEAETRFLLDLAARHSEIGGVVGWVDFESADAPAAVARLAADPLLVGLRPMVHDIADPDWLLRADLGPAFAALARHGLVFDALVRPCHLSRLLQLAERHPDLTIVVDHLAKPDIAAGLLAPWADDLAALGRSPSVVCKLSGMVTEAPADWTVDDLRPFFARALACFGPERLLWGSDWPVVERAGGYDRWLDATDTLLQDLPEEQRTAVLGSNAARIYGAAGRGRFAC